MANSQPTTNGDAITNETPDQSMEVGDDVTNLLKCSDNDDDEGYKVVLKPRAKISFFKTSRQPAVPERKICFSVKGSLRRSNLHFAPPINYFQMIPETERAEKELFTKTFQETEIQNLKAGI